MVIPRSLTPSTCARCFHVSQKYDPSKDLSALSGLLGQTEDLLGFFQCGCKKKCLSTTSVDPSVSLRHPQPLGQMLSSLLPNVLLRPAARPPAGAAFPGRAQLTGAPAPARAGRRPRRQRQPPGKAPPQGCAGAGAQRRAGRRRRRRSLNLRNQP